MQPGESLEEAVRRETREEVGLEVGDIVYHSSQPWPGTYPKYCIILQKVDVRVQLGALAIRSSVLFYAYLAT